MSKANLEKGLAGVTCHHIKMLVQVGIIDD